MATVVYIKLCSSNKSKKQLIQDYNYLFNASKKFEKNYSRFLSGNKLDIFNNSKKGKISKEFYNILKISKKYYLLTNKIFDIGVLPVLQNQGYIVSKLKGYTGKVTKIEPQKFISVNKLNLNSNYTYSKPQDLKIDLGGIGKGYLINKLKNILIKMGYIDFILDFGGDIYFAGKNIDIKSGEYICAVSNPLNKSSNLEYLKLNNIGVATSTTTKRVWELNNKTKNHLINTKNNQSTKSNIIQCTVISKNIIKADILAKSLLLMGLKNAIKYAKIHKVSAIFITKNLKLYKTPYVKKYIY